MGQGFIAVLFSASVFLAILFIIRQFSGERASIEHKQRVLGQIYDDHKQYTEQQAQESVNILKGSTSSLGKMLSSLPFGEKALELILKAGLEYKIMNIIMGAGIVFAVAFFASLRFFDPAIALLIAAVCAILLPRFYLRRKISKRNEAFINQFPDAVDMIVRSVKSGHPLNTALRMIADNMDPPVKTEFRQLVDEIAFGRSTVEALVRMSKRIDEPDLQFFVVILSVQQETGGNLAEVLTNLSGIIRKRKQLRLRIKAMTSEGRATAYILGSLPLFVFGAIHMTSPDYLLPLFETSSGHTIIMAAVGLVALAGFIVHNMLQIDI